MFPGSKLIGFLNTTDPERARDFYVTKLGLDFVTVDDFALVVQTGGNTVRIVKAATFTPAQGTVLGWEVEDIRAAVLWLNGQGVTTEKYPFVADKELGIWTAPTGDLVAWFKDPDGNVLSFSHHV